MTQGEERGAVGNRNVSAEDVTQKNTLTIQSLTGMFLLASLLIPVVYSSLTLFLCRGKVAVCVVFLLLLNPLLVPGSKTECGVQSGGRSTRQKT